MKAVILAGGKGTRLGAHTAAIPKPLVPLAGKPIIEHQLNVLRRYGFEDVIIIIGHLGEQIEDQLGDGSRWDINIDYYHEKEPLGTVGGLKEIEDRLTEDFLLVYGDVMFDMDLERLVQFHKDRESEGTLVVHPNDHPYDSDLLDIDKHGRITAFHPKPHDEDKWYRNLVNAGVYLLSPSILPYLEKGVKADFGKDIFPKIYKDAALYGYNTPEYLKDMGTPDRLEKVTNDLLTGKIAAQNLSNPRPAVFLDRDGVINIDSHLIHKPEQLEIYPFAAEAIKKINASGYLAVVVTNQSVVARNLVDEEGLRIIHNRLETELGVDGAKLDAIFYCPHHPDGGFEGENADYKIVCECRKPKSGMFLQAAKDLNIDLNNSFIIGDSERDLLAGKKVGCTTVGVATGKGLRSSVLLPDYFFGDLGKAVDFLFDSPYEKIASEISSKIDKKGFVIGIAGNTRSGKTTLTSYLQKKLEEQGRKVLRISLDDWLVPKEKRNGTHDFSENFQLKQLPQDLNSILKGIEITVDGYARHPDQEPQPVTYRYTNEDVVIVEGVVALHDDQLRELFDYKVYVKIPDKQHKIRVISYYKWKGLSDVEAEALYLERKTSEYDLIAQDATFADITWSPVK